MRGQIARHQMLDRYAIRVRNDNGATGAARNLLSTLQARAVPAGNKLHPEPQTSRSQLAMDVSEPTPRVNFELMQRHMHKKVLLVGQIEGIDNNVARVRAADGGTVQVMTKPGGIFNTQFVQFEGIVESPTQLAEVDHTSFGDSLGGSLCMRISYAGRLLDGTFDQSSHMVCRFGRIQ